MIVVVAAKSYNLFLQNFLSFRKQEFIDSKQVLILFVENYLAIRRYCQKVSIIAFTFYSFQVCLPVALPLDFRYFHDTGY